MQQICRECPVRKQCLEHALTYEVRSPRPPQYGIFGGLTPTERRELWQERRDIMKDLEKRTRELAEKVEKIKEEPRQMTQYEVHSPDPARYHERHKPGKRVYIAGRITGVPLFKLSFSIAAFTLVFRGYEPVNPASIRLWPRSRSLVGGLHAGLPADARDV